MFVYFFRPSLSLAHSIYLLHLKWSIYWPKYLSCILFLLLLVKKNKWLSHCLELNILLVGSLRCIKINNFRIIWLLPQFRQAYGGTWFWCLLLLLLFFALVVRWAQRVSCNTSKFAQLWNPSIQLEWNVLSNTDREILVDIYIYSYNVNRMRIHSVRYNHQLRLLNCYEIQKYHWPIVDWILCSYRIVCRKSKFQNFARLFRPTSFERFQRFEHLCDFKV